MKILFLITRGDSIGGAQVHLKDLVLQLHSDGNEITVAMGQEGIFSNLLRELNITVVIIPHLIRKLSPMDDIIALKEIYQSIQKIEPDMLALHSSKAGILGRIVAFVTKKPVVFTVHGWSFTEGVSSKKRIIYRYIEKLITYITDKIITVSEYDKKLALSLNVAHEDKMIAIHNGMKDIKKELHTLYSNKIPKIIMVARFQEPKNHEMLIEALNSLKDKAWTLDFVGEDGGLMSEAKQLTSKLELEDRVRFLGNRNDVEILLSQSDIFVLTSYWEGFPLTTIEAMRAGLPVIASDVGGVSEAIVDSETGFLVRNKCNLENSLKILLDSAEERKRMGQKGRERYLDYFTFDEMYRKTLEVYEKII